MSETHTKAFAGLQRAALGIALALSLGLAGSLRAWADGELALKNVTVDASKQLVVQFASGQGAPQAPKLMEMPAPNHQLLIDFTGVCLDETTIPSGDQLTKQLAGKMPGVKAARVGILGNATTPTVRVALDLDAELVIKPSVASLQDGSAVISLGDEYTASARGGETTASAGGGAPSSATPTSASAANDPAAAYEEYYRKFLQQKQISDAQNNPKDKNAEWGPRKGTLAEAKAIKNGMRVIGTPINSPALADIPVASAETPVQTAPAKHKGAPVAAAVEQPAMSEAPAEAATSAQSPENAPVAKATPVAEAVPAKEEAPAAESMPAAKAAPVAEATPEASPAAEAAPESKAAPVAEAEPVAKAAPASQIADSAPTPKEEQGAQMQPDMVADADAGSKNAPPAAESEVAPRDQAPKPGKTKRAVVASAAMAEGDSAASPADAAAAAAGDAGAAIRTKKEQDKPENQPHVTSPADSEAPVQAETPRRRAIKLFNAAHTSHLNGHVAQAILQYKEAIKVDPELGEAHSDLGLAYNQQHNYASALSEFHKALAINPRDAITYNSVGAALRAEHDMPAAIQNWETAVKIDPKLAVAHYNLGTAYEAEGDFDRALVSYENAVKNDQRMGEAYFRMGLIMQKRHRLQDARAHYKQALKVSADSDYAAEAREKIAAIDKLAK